MSAACTRFEFEAPDPGEAMALRQLLPLFMTKTLTHALANDFVVLREHWLAHRERVCDRADADDGGHDLIGLKA